MKTVAEARREAGIPESDYLRRGDSTQRIATIRCLARWFGPPDSRTEHIDSCQLHWSAASGVEARTVVVLEEGAITS